MAQPPHQTAHRLERLADELQSLASDFASPARSALDAEDRIGRAEGIAQAVRAAVRGRVA